MKKSISKPMFPSVNKSQYASKEGICLTDIL